MRERINIMKRSVRKKRWFVLLFLVWMLCTAAAVIVLCRQRVIVSPCEVLEEYVRCIGKKDYDGMYDMLDVGKSGIKREHFIKRNADIYEGIEANNIEINILSYDEENMNVSYQVSLDTVAGEIKYANEAAFTKTENKYKLIWDDSMIFPELNSTDRVKVLTTSAKRGQVLDRNGRVLAGEGDACSAGIVPGKMENREDTIQRAATLLEIKPEEIEKKLSAEWVKDDSFVPIKTIPKVNELEIMSFEPDENMVAEKERQDKLLDIDGVKITNIKVREYPLGEASAHLTGYVQGITAEDLEEHAGEGYTSDCVIGKSGMESLFEEDLRGHNGCSIYIIDSEGNKKLCLANMVVQNGKDVKLTIDSELQKSLYDKFKDDRSCSVAMNPYTGEVLALVSTPSYNSNDFIKGMSYEQWTSINEDENKPMYNRFRQMWCPGSTFKPIIAAVGLDSGAINPEEDYGNEGLSWQKDSSWGSYFVTTLHAYEPVTMENALIYSDNIYFAKAALNIGAEEIQNSLNDIGFNLDLPFEIKMAQSQYSNTEKIETEIQLADTGYGQGQVLVNPLHMACIYSAFCNEGNMVKPYLVYKNEIQTEYWIQGAFSIETANLVLNGIKEVINNPNGTGRLAHKDDVVLAGKTGTAEIKADKEDTSGTEHGWFAVFTADKEVERPIMIISMVEDVKGKGGSGYVVKKDSQVLDEWFNN